MKLLIVCASILGSLLAAAAGPESISDQIRALDVQYRAALGDQVTLLLDDAEVNRLAASTVEHFDAYLGMVPAGVKVDNPDFLRVAAVRNLVCNMINAMGDERFDPGADWLKARYTELDKLDGAIFALYGKIQP